MHTPSTLLLFESNHTTRAILLLLVQGRNVTRIVDKMLRNAFNLGYVQLTLPRACILHTVRHPLDVALSCFSQPFEGRGLPWASQLDGDPPLSPTSSQRDCCSHVRASSSSSIQI